MFGLANAFQLKRDFRRAESIYLGILEKDRGFIKAYYNLGTIYAYHIGDRDKMESYWGKFMALSPDKAEVRFIKKEMERLQRAD
jgi:tetratricopeptide (TPR) repeat protein